MQNKIVWKCTLKRVLWIIVMAIITTMGIISINGYKQNLIGIILIFIGLGLFFYKMKTWERYNTEKVIQ